MNVPEIALLRGGSSNLSIRECGEDGILLEELVKFFNNGDFLSIITHEKCSAIFPRISSIQQLDKLESAISTGAKEFVQGNGKDENNVRQLILLTLAVAHIQFFVQQNWVGPPACFDGSSLILDHNAETEEETKLFHSELIDRLSVDGEVCYSLLRQPESLYLAKLILFNCTECLDNCQTADLWRLHCLRLQQSILDSRVFTLKNLIMDLIEKLPEKNFLKDKENRDILIQFHLESAYLYIFYYRYTHGQEHVDKAVALSKLSVNLTGALGKRTKFQEEDLAQLVLQVVRNGEKDTKDLPAEITPVDVSLDDDTVLNRLNLTEGLESEETITMLEQALLLGMCMYNKRNSPGDEITAEQTVAYLNYIIPHANSWCVKSIALITRTVEEKESFRRQQRGVMQLEELVHQFSREKPCVKQRLDMFHCVDMLPSWLVEREYANYLYKMGSHNTALDVFEHLQLWEDVIRCYAALGRREKAEELIREQLEIKPTPILYCYLGDVTRDIENYQKAWDLSKNRSARAMRSLGFHYLQKEEYEKCMECFEKTLRVNHLQRSVWFSYACAAMLLKKYHDAVTGFHSCLEVDADNAEAWNNLGSTYIKLNDKPKALMIYKEAVKRSYENWRIWQNLLMVGADCGDFTGAIQAYHRLLDIKGKFTDAEVLHILVRAVNEDLEDQRGEPASSLRPKLQELFGKITSKVTGESEVWQNYAELISGQPDLTQEHKEKATSLLQKAQRCVTQQPNWQKDVAKCKSVSNMTLKVVDSYQRCCECLNDSEHAKKLLSSARIMVKGVLSNIRQAQTDPVSQTLNSEVEESTQKLEDSLKVVIGLLEKQSEQ